MPDRHSLRAALIENRRRQREYGFAFEFTVSNLGIPEDDQIKQGRVRRLNLADRATIDALPTHLQSTVWEGVKEFEKLQKANRAGKADPQSLMEAVMNNQKSMKAADAFCVAAFISPVIVATEDEFDRNPEANYVVTDIAEEDRLNVFMICLDGDSEQAKKLKLFRPERTADAAARPTGAMAPTSIRADEPAVAGV
ncbi:MAG: hypothetical protein M3440_11940 [Chloroflexota bacterium]|nr:hypothetical protein [Chloroflexota bacterium]